MLDSILHRTKKSANWSVRGMDLRAPRGDDGAREGHDMRQPLMTTLMLLTIAGRAEAQVWSAHFADDGLPYFAAASDSATGASPLVVSSIGDAQMEVPLDQHWFNLDCNFWGSITGASLVLDVVGSAGCESGCTLEAAVATTGGQLRPVDRAVVWPATTQVRFDVGQSVGAVRGGDAPLAFSVRLARGAGQVQLASRESDPTRPPRVEVQNAPITDDVPVGVTRRSLRLSSDVTLSYLEAGDPNSENVFLMVHGMPAYSILFRNVAQALAHQGHVIAVDWAGVGYSSPLTQAQFGMNGDPSLQTDSELGAMAPETHSFFEAQANYLALLVQRLGLVRPDRKLILVIHEVGGLGGFRFATTHHDWIAGIAFADTWIDVCPDALFAAGYCQKETLAPAPYFGAWAFCVYPSVDCACNQLILPSFVGPAVPAGLMVRNASAVLHDRYIAPYGGSSATCDTVFGLTAFPYNITVPTETLGVPEPTRALNTRVVYDGYIADLRQWQVPKLMLVGAPPPPAADARGDVLGIVDGSQVDFARATYPHLNASCVGYAGHFSPEDVPWNYASRIVDWGRREHLLQ
jgi:pimeloyl-ACP methyl ester carboxylesterase